VRRIGFGLAVVVSLFFMGLVARATIFSSVRGIVHDPQHRPVVGANLRLKSRTSDFSLSTQSDQDGQFTFSAVPIGDYNVTVTAPGFEASVQEMTVVADSSPVLHFMLDLAAVQQAVRVSAEPTPANVESVTPTTLIDRQDIAQTPGADRTNAAQMITDYVPASCVTHDMMHVRGGHQVNWLIDGVPIPNTNIATNLGPQIDPKNIDYMEVMRGSYEAAYGDRTYGVFNIVPRNGFERNNEAEFVASFGNWYQTNDQINLGGHIERFAYYASLNGNGSNYGLQPPIGQVFHDAENGYGGFASFIFNPDSKNQFRLVTSLRQDYYQIPIDPDPNSPGNQVYPSYGVRDSEREPDGYVIFSWVHTFDPNVLLTVSPFYHYNQASYNASPNDVPVIANVNQTANYGGLQATLAAHFSRNDVQGGVPRPA
jgi:Carboxypeptidase regulatory-like domain/TonB-dependent Receptor Plug Domain